jgi:hypothetical protein
MRFRHLLGALLIALAALLGVATPAGADPAKPGDYKSVITRIEPDAAGIHLDVVGGDGFLELRVDRDHEVVVEGYSGEPWLRIRKDGTIEENTRSEATYLNADRYAQISLPANVDNEAAPDWKVIGHDGTHVWHDHRIHWMSPARPPGMQAGDVVIPDWTVKMTVDGSPVVAHGTLTWEPPESVAPWVVLAIATLAVVLLLARRHPMETVAAAVAVSSVAATIVGLGQRAATPTAAGGTPLVAIIPAIGFITGLAALALRRKPAAVVVALGGVAAISGWALLRLAVLTHPVLPTDLPANVDRGVTAMAIGTAIAAAYASVTSGVLRPPDEDERASDHPVGTT